MKRNSRTVVLLFMVLVVALASLAVAYGLWSKTLTIDGTVMTGSVNAEFIDGFTDDDGTVNDPMADPTADPPVPARDADDNGLDPAATGPDTKERYDKDVARCDAALTDPDEEQPGMQGASVTIENGYPSYHCTAWFGIHNNGSVPVKVQAIEQRVNVDHSYSCDSGATWTPALRLEWYPYCGTSVVKHIDLDGDGQPEFDVHVTKLLIGEQIDPSHHSGIDIDIHVAQGAFQDDTVVFNERVLLVQWNEYTP